MATELSTLDICDGTENLPIYYVSGGVKKSLDIEKYVCCNIPGAELDLRDFEDLIKGCDCCDNCAGDVSSAMIIEPQEALGDMQVPKCPCTGRSGCMYDKDGRLTPASRDDPSSLPLITECNSRCSCPETCRNRMVQKGIRYKLEVFEHAEKGLSLRTLEFIKELTFICEYAGEVLNYEEAKQRAVQQTDKDMNYIFVLREHFSSGTLTTYIDPCKKGNIGRFLNHSCMPNAFIVPIRVENMVPKLCVFARREIKPGEEITYDYGSQNDAGICDGKRDGQSEKNVKRDACHCLSENCMGVLPFDSTLFQ